MQQQTLKEAKAFWPVAGNRLSASDNRFIKLLVY
jgi:hypothetical protein